MLQWYEMQRDTVYFSFARFTLRQGMSTKIVSFLVPVAAGALAGCGFKSDLFLPQQQDKQLFEAGAQTGSADTLQPDPSSGAVEDETIMLDKITTVATDGEILVPNTEPDDEGAEGIPVDLTEITRDVERSNNQ